MRHLVLAALGLALAAEFGTQPADFLHVVAVLSHERRCKAADLGALHVKPHALGHHLDVVFLKTGHRTVIAVGRTNITRFNTRLVLLEFHLGLQLKQIHLK